VLLGTCATSKARTCVGGLRPGDCTPAAGRPPAAAAGRLVGKQDERARCCTRATLPVPARVVRGVPTAVCCDTTHHIHGCCCAEQVQVLVQLSCGMRLLQLRLRWCGRASHWWRPTAAAAVFGARPQEKRARPAPAGTLATSCNAPPLMERAPAGSSGASPGAVKSNATAVRMFAPICGYSPLRPRSTAPAAI
jgi:hypothetical protein